MKEDKFIRDPISGAALSVDRTEIREYQRKKTLAKKAIQSLETRLSILEKTVKDLRSIVEKNKDN